MPSQREQRSQKLVYLRDRAPRAKARAAHKGRARPIDVSSSPDSETLWLARFCFGVAGILLLYWLGVLGFHGGPQNADTWSWILSEGFPHLVVAVGAAFVAQSLLRSGPRAPQWVALLAGGLIILSLQGITRAMVAGDLDHLSLTIRIEVFVRTATLAIGIWAASYALRMPCGNTTTD